MYDCIGKEDFLDTFADHCFMCKRAYREGTTAYKNLLDLYERDYEVDEWKN
jgi:hypothetical protein